MDVLEINAFDLMNRLSVIYDARQQWKVDHKLADILLLVICAVIAGCEGWEETEDFGNERLDWLKKYGEFEYGIPSHHTIARVVAAINPKQFQKCFIDWTGMKTLGIILSARMEDGVFNTDDISVRYYISSAELTAEKFAHAAREHWAIENKLHWKMDVAMREDDCRIRRGNAAEMLTGFRHMAVNMLIPKPLKLV